MLELETITTNGYLDFDTMTQYIKDGYTFVVTIPATLCDPHACKHDKLSIFSRYVEAQPNLCEDCLYSTNLINGACICNFNKEVEEDCLLNKRNRFTPIRHCCE